MSEYLFLEHYLSPFHQTTQKKTSKYQRVIEQLQTLLLTHGTYYEQYSDLGPGVTSSSISLDTHILHTPIYENTYIYI